MRLARRPELVTRREGRGIPLDMTTQAHNDRDAGTNGTVWHEAYPELGTEPIPIEPCVSPEYFELERERIYKQTWLNVGRIEQLPRPGDYFVQDLPSVIRRSS